MSIDPAVPVASFAWDVLKWVVVPIKRQFGYVISSKSYAQDLQEEVEKLAYEADMVHNDVEAARNNGREVYSHVTEWQAKAEKALKEAGDLLGDFEKENKTCCYGSLPEPCCRYQFSRKAKDKIEVIRRLTGEWSEFRDISFIDPAPGTPPRREGEHVVQLTTPVTASVFPALTSVKLRDDGVFKSRALMIRKIMDALADNSNSVVGVYGMGGVGKSTLLEDVKRILIEERSFDWVAKADVSINPNIETIQGEIAHGLKLTDIESTKNINVRAELLRHRLDKEGREKKKVLIILDNLWEKLDLKSVGIRCGHDNKAIGCKLLLTSRDQHLLQREMGCDREFPLRGLEKEEARALFERTVGDKVHDNEFKPWVEVALHRCAGVPFLIVAMAKRFKKAELFEWKDALRNMEKFNHEEINALIDGMLKWSYDKLKDEEKKLLRLCVVCGVSKPSLEYLVRYGFGLGIFRGVGSMEAAGDRLRTHIRALQASALLLDSEDVGGFKIHDLVRKFVALVSSRDHHPLLVLEDKVKSVTELPEDELESCEAMCFPNMKELPSELNCPKLRILLMSTNDASLHIPDSYFNSMRNLMVLNLARVRLTCSPSPFQLLANVHTLCFQNCSFEDVAILGNLKRLQILSIVNSKIQRLPKEIGQLVELRSLDLSDCPELEIIEPGVLQSLTNLEELYLKQSFHHWSAGEQTQPTNASLSELNHMKKLCTLHVSIPDPRVLPDDLYVEKLTKYEIRIGKEWRRWEEWRQWEEWEEWKDCNGSRTLELKLDPFRDVLRKECIKSILDKTNDLLLDQLDGSEQSICALSRKGFPELKHLQVKNSPSVCYILEWPSLPALETLLLKNLINLEKIYHNHISIESFSTLKEVRVDSCDKMEVLFPRSVVRQLSHLEKIKVRRCKLMRGIVEADDDRGKLEFPKLRVLELCDLPNIANFFSAGSSPSRSTSDDQVGTQIAFLNGEQVAFPSLATLTFRDLDNVGFMFSPSMVKSLAQPRNLTVGFCKKMEAIITEEEGLGVEISETLSFPMLTNLSLSYLGSLTRFSNSSQETQSPDHVKSRCSALFTQEVALPSLEKLCITGLDNIQMIWDNQVVVESFPKLKSLYVDECNKFVTVVPSFVLGQLKSLESLEAKACVSLEVVFELQPLIPLDGHPVALPLRELTISGLPKLKCVWDKELHRQVKFQRLRSVSVSKCNSLTSLFLASVTGDLIQLEELVIHECGIAELIEEEEELLVPGFEFPKLTSLRLEHPTKLKCLYNGTHTSHWPTLKTLKMDDRSKVGILASQTENEIPRHKQPLFLIEKGAFPNLEELELDLCERMEIWHGDFHDEEFLRKLRVLELRHLSKESATSTSRFIENLTNLEELVVRESYLEEPSSNVEAMEGPSQEQKVILPFSRQIKHPKALNVSDCDGLSSMFTSTTAENLVALTKLRISNCRILTEVISENGSKEEHEVAFHHLKCMELDGLIELKCFSSGGCALIFPILEDVIVNGCPNMKFFSEGPIEAPKLERVKVDRAGFWKENLNMTIQYMFKEMATVAKAEFVRLFEFPDLVGKWDNEHNPVNSSWQLETPVVDKCPSFINAVPSKLMLVLEEMTSLHVRDCKSLEQIFDLQGLEAMESTRVLPRLKNLNFINLPKLRQLWNKDLQGTMRFDALFSLTLYKCSNLRHAFTPSMAWCLANLYHMEIKECDRMEGVIEEEEGRGSTVEKISFPRLGRMTPKWLPNLTSFLLGKNHVLDCPKIEYPRIAHCSKMRSLTWQSSLDIDHSTPSLFTARVQFPGLARMALSHMDNLGKIWTDNPLETLTFDSLWEVKVKNCKSLENLFPHWVATSLTQLEKLRMESCRIEEIIANGDDNPHSNIAQVLFPKPTSLVLHEMPGLKTFCPNLPTLNWPFLKKLQVTHRDKCSWTQGNDQRDLLDQEAHSSFERDFPNLERLLLVHKDIEMIQDGKYLDDIFGKLKAITLACFHEENAVFPPRFVLERFLNLESLEVFCSSFEDIFPDEGFVDEERNSVLESLRELKLSKLHKLKRVWREDRLVSKILLSIYRLEVRDCPDLTVLFPAVTSFRNLMELVVKNSSGLVHLGTASAIASLVHLEKMTIIGCEKMKEVVANDENGEGKVISFEKLNILTLKNMPSLECFSSTTSCILRFSSFLFWIKVEECPKMKIFSKGTLSTPYLKRGTLFGYEWERNWEGMGDLNRAIQKLSS
ncbi:uncharacterized protein LOC115726779 [Rhodamnia argentea]|uniref:Uncharacterized protein LOC115726779 n=1 Tax=Rhodamnia argentea TaxID=178133 RepID=A0ABM3HGM3_9MYRT|nr:uncharacterized protein LOC115726779 [Rhodamnia argentea]